MHGNALVQKTALAALGAQSPKGLGVFLSGDGYSRPHSRQRSRAQAYEGAWSLSHSLGFWGWDTANVWY